MCNTLQCYVKYLPVYTISVAISLCSKVYPEKPKLADNWIDGAFDVLVMERKRSEMFAALIFILGYFQ